MVHYNQNAINRFLVQRILKKKTVGFIQHDIHVRVGAEWMKKKIKRENKFQKIILMKQE